MSCMYLMVLEQCSFSSYTFHCVRMCCCLIFLKFPSWFARAAFREGAIDRLVGIYKDVVHKTGVINAFPLYFRTIIMPGLIAWEINAFKLVFFLQGYLTEHGFVNLERVELIMQAVGVAEDNIFKKRKEDEVQHSALMKENNQWFPQLIPKCFTPCLTRIRVLMFCLFEWLCEGSLCFL